MWCRAVRPYRSNRSLICGGCGGAVERSPRDGGSRCHNDAADAYSGPWMFTCRRPHRANYSTSVRSAVQFDNRRGLALRGLQAA